MILLTLVPETKLNADKRTLPEYTVHIVGSEYLPGDETVKHRECLSKANEKMVYKGLK